ncbi:MAG: pesticidal protein Cry7Aa [Candidatus Omnitrophica bacterium]|nr:pesticidal protein Cry7Aa [Candidatus Omnitrophota bacterium]
MIDIRDEGIILESSQNHFDNQAVLNPACIEKDGIIHMFYRAVSKPGMCSSIGYCQLKDNKVIRRMSRPLLFPEYDYERMGVEDPRIVLLEGVYYLFYTVYDGKNALFAYATSADLVNFKKQGIISARITYAEAARLFGSSHTKLREKYFVFDAYIRDRQGDDILLWEKDAFIFPKKFNNRFALVHRVLPGIQVIYFDDFSELTDDHWRGYFQEMGDHILLEPEYGYESRNIGGGSPPIETKDGWIFIYHAVEDAKEGRIYHASCALLDLEDPQKVIGRLKEPLFSPSKEWEKIGDVNNVVFPTASLIKEGRLHIYYGAADKIIAAKSLDLEELLRELKRSI